MTAKNLAYQITKYPQRDGWSHRDLLRLSHPKATGDLQDVLHYAVTGEIPQGGASMDDPLGQFKNEACQYLHVVEAAKKAKDASFVVGLIRDYNLPRECVPTQFLKDAQVWRALLEKMPMTAMIRNLAVMSRVGILTPLSDETAKVVSELRNAERLRKARIHPIQMLSALRVYSAGGRDTYVSRSHGEPFTPIDVIKSALEEGFYLSFGNVEPTGKKTLMAFDISGSMDSGVIAGVPGLTPREASAAMGMVTARSEWSGDRPQFHSVAFETNVTPFSISPKESLEQVVKKMRNMHMGGTDTSAPMRYALQHKLPVEVFITYTDNECWAGREHTSEALRRYRRETGIQARSVVVGLTSTGFSIADPKCPLDLDVVGFDSAAPALISSFARGEL